jgi:membrane-bound lytic murein transglycosylase B
MATATSTCSATWPTPSAVSRTTWQVHGWQRGLPTHFGVSPPDEAQGRALLLEPDIKPSFTASQFAEQGARLDEAGRSHDGLLALVEVRNGDAAPSHVAGTQNFYALTRYNWSAYYAMAVISLGQAVRSARSGAPARGVDTRAAPGAGAQSGS